MKQRGVLGIDTSNYKTSVAIVGEDGSILYDSREFLKVKQGEKGLRQSDALFQHIKVLPSLLEEAFATCRDPAAETEIVAIACSAKPRPVEGSYMPVFLAGESFGRSLAASLGVPIFSFSHQEGHIEAVKAFSPLKDQRELLVCHFSGGTCELLKTHTKEDDPAAYEIQIIGGSKDISFGQVLDRAGVLLGFAFPAGEELDKLALREEAGRETEFLTAVKVKDGWLNLSGMDTQIKRRIQQDPQLPYGFVREIFSRMTVAMAQMIMQGAGASGISQVIMAGGVSSSRFIREALTDQLKKEGIGVVFDTDGLSQDNAVGTALLGGKRIWQSNR